MNPSLSALFVLRIVGSSLLTFNALLFYFINDLQQQPLSTTISQITPVVVRVAVPRSRLIIALLSLAALTYFLDALVVIVVAVIYHTWQGSSPAWKGIEIGDFLGLFAFAFAAILGTLKEAQGKDVWTKKRVRFFALLACAFDITIVFLMAFNIDFRRQDDSVRIPELPPRFQVSLPEFAHLALAILRLLFAIPLLTALSFPRHNYVSLFTPPTQQVDPSSAALTTDFHSRYGTFNTTPAVTNPPSPVNGSQSVLPKKPDPKEEISLDPSWSELAQRIRRLGPYLFPRNDRSLQGLAFLCIVILILGRFVNFLLPLALGRLVNILERYAATPNNSVRTSLWITLLFYAGFRFLQSPGGLAALRDSLWAPVMQYSDRNMSQLTFDHLLNLSLSFHTRRKTGEILRILDRGASINHILELILFNIIPTIVDMIVALTFFFVYFDWSLALVLFIVMGAYVSASIALTTWRTKIRRKMNDQDVITRGIHTDCLLNYETVKYFGGESHEGQRYAKAILKYQQLEYRVMLSLNLLNLIQTTIISLGLLAGSAIVANSILQGKRDSSDFIVFITYLSQLYGPLNQLGYIYRSINQSLVDTERLMKLLDEPKDVVDKPDSTELVVHEGEIKFENVSFSYDGRSQALNGVTFTVPKGCRVALVGESGSGKSTILRLLYRFYDLEPGKGRILIDGKDIRDVTQQSLRKAIGVVPQDSVLFNTSIKYNIGYGKFGAPDEDIESAAKLAQMHDRIMSFPDGYDTKVGERGVRLSGGEKQRVAIARTLLKNPPILLLDEATSALDTSTERDIQKALQHLMMGRSSLSIAHRLSTIASSDLILVLNDGRIVEHGSHKELLSREGVFARMWQDQVNADRRAQSIGSPGKESALGYLIDDVSTTLPQELDSTDLVTGSPQVGGNLLNDTILDTGGLVEEPTASADLEQTILDDVKSENPESHEPNQSAEPLDQRSEGQANVQHKAEPSYASVAATLPGAASAVLTTESDKPLGPTVDAISFPVKADDASSQKASSSVVAHAAGVTFSPEIDATPSRSETPDAEIQPKRKRISSQNFQRLARRISLGGRRSSAGSSGGSPGQDGGSGRPSTEELKGEPTQGKKERKAKKKSAK